MPTIDLVEIGMYAEGESVDDLPEPLYLEKHRIRSGGQTATVCVPAEPATSLTRG